MHIMRIYQFSNEGIDIPNPCNPDGIASDDASLKENRKKCTSAKKA